MTGYERIVAIMLQLFHAWKSSSLTHIRFNRFTTLTLVIFSLLGLELSSGYTFMKPIPRLLSSVGTKSDVLSKRNLRKYHMSMNRSKEVEAKPLQSHIVYAQNVLEARWSSGTNLKVNGSSEDGKEEEHEKSEEDEEDDDDIDEDYLRRRSEYGAWFEERSHIMDSVLDSVVRIYCTHNLPSFTMPWQRMRQDQSTSTGFIIDGKRVITNAHSVEYSTMIQVRKRGSDRKYLAKPVAIGEECDLAILSIDDDRFWDDTEPLKMGSLAKLTDDVSVVGYPIGGECISITAGVVSRVEMTTYAQADMELLGIQIDAAINPGNSGGPVVNDAGEVIGVAFQTLNGEDVENIGYVVPVNVLQHFLEDVNRHNGAYTGFPRLGVGLQLLESATMRSMLLMSETAGMTGVMVSDIELTAPAKEILLKNDVILSVDGIKVANDGTIPFREGERVALRYYFSQLFKGDEVSITLLREGKILTLTVPLCSVDILCPFHFQGAPPTYAVFGGLVFTVLSDPYLRELYESQRKTITYLSTLAQFSRRTSLDEDLVILTQVLAHTTSIGYESYENLQLLKFNNERVRSISHLCEMVDSLTSEQEYLKFEFYPDKMIVLKFADLNLSTFEVCEDNAIPFPRSKNLLLRIREESD